MSTDLGGKSGGHADSNTCAQYACDQGKAPPDMGTSDIFDRLKIARLCM